MSFCLEYPLISGRLLVDGNDFYVGNFESEPQKLITENNISLLKSPIVEALNDKGQPASIEMSFEELGNMISDLEVVMYYYWDKYTSVQRTSYSRVEPNRERVYQSNVKVSVSKSPGVVEKEVYVSEWSGEYGNGDNSLENYPYFIYAGDWCEAVYWNRGSTPPWRVQYYELKETTYYVKGSLVGEVNSTESGTYPSNGRHTDGYWYVLKEK